MVVYVDGSVIKSGKEPWLGRMEVNGFDAVRAVELFSLQGNMIVNAFCKYMANTLTFTSNSIMARREEDTLRIGRW